MNPYRLTDPKAAPADDNARGYAEYGAAEDAAGPTPRPHPAAEGYGGSYGQHDYAASARRSERRSRQRYHDSAGDKR